MITIPALLLAASVQAAPQVKFAALPPEAHESDRFVEAEVRSSVGAKWADSLQAPDGYSDESTAGFSAQDRQSLRDSVAAKSDLRKQITIADAAEKSRMMGRLPGVSEDPFNVCRSLERCYAAPTSFHVEDEAMIPDALVALARPWIALEKARGRRLHLEPVSGSNLVARLDATGGPLEIRAEPATTGGYDVWIGDSDAAARRFLAAKAEVLGQN